ncbi:MAG: Gx transporter family protein [Ruminococcaceae bacterium]|nr:Gx transporter family protein [Oscillospiraceae bacterium]
MDRIKKTVLLAMMSAVALALSFLESQIPTFIAIPGVKLGLANIAVIFVLYKLGAKEAFAVSFVRLIAVFLLFGGVMPLIYSIAGALLSLCVMLILKGLPTFSEIGVSVAGGVAHNIAQVLVAVFLLDSSAIFLYLPALLLSGTVAGVVIGIISAILVKRVKIKTL